jgi:hypothetical protein
VIVTRQRSGLANSAHAEVSGRDSAERLAGEVIPCLPFGDPPRVFCAQQRERLVAEEDAQRRFLASAMARIAGPVASGSPRRAGALAGMLARNLSTPAASGPYG